MTNYFFDTEESFKKFIPVNVTLTIGDLQDRLHNVGLQYIKPKIGQLYDTTLQMYQDGNDYALTPLIQRSIANFALYHQLPFIEVAISDSGINRIESENEKTAYKYQKESLRSALLNDAFTALEYLVIAIESDINSYIWYRDSSDSPRFDNNKNLLNNSIEFNRHYRLHHPASTFDFLKPVVEAVEGFIIKSYIGEDYYDDLQIKKKNGSLSEDDRNALYLIQAAIVNFTIEFTAKAGAGMPSRDGFRIKTQASEHTDSIMATKKQIIMTTNHYKMTAYMYISKLLKLLDTPNKYLHYKAFKEQESLPDTSQPSQTQTHRAIHRF